MSKVIPLIAALAMLAASGLMMYSVVEFRATVQMDPELERLAIAYYRDQAERREQGRKIDAANRAAERNLVIPQELPPAKLNFSQSHK